MLLSKKTVKGYSDNYLSLLKALGIAIRLVKNVVENSTDSEVVFELNNSTVISWLNERNVKDKYYEDFMSVMELLDSIPVKYSFVYNSNPSAMIYCSTSYLDKPKIGGLFDS